MKVNGGVAFFLVGATVAFASLARAAENELAVAREALRDGLWEVARTHAGRVNSDEAKLIVLESLAGEDRWDEIGKRLSGWGAVRGAGFDYYRAAVKGDRAEAMAILRRAGSEEGILQAKLHEAELQAKDGHRDVACGIWREVAANTNAGERALAVACCNLMDAALLRKVYGAIGNVQLRRMVGCRLGMALLSDAKTVDEGERLVRSIVRESPDADGARAAFLALADAQVAKGDWKAASETYHQAIETWPDLAKSGVVQEGRGWVFENLRLYGEALEAFALAGSLATDDEARAVAAVKEGDVLQKMGRSDDSMQKYKFVLQKYPKARAAAGLTTVVEVREREARGRESYRNFRFGEAMAEFEAVAKADPACRNRMEFFAALCLYGQGRGDEACERVRKLVEDCADADIRREATLWLGKYLFNRREWKESGRRFAESAAMTGDAAAAADALLWAARAAFAAGDFARTIQLTSSIAERDAGSGRAKHLALLVQGEALVELARFDEAVLVLDRVVASDAFSSADRSKARMLKADALYAMGADNAVRYEAALEAYRAVRFGEELSPSDRLVLSFKIARTLEKLKRTSEAIDQYYTQVVLPYREGRLSNGRFSDEARAVFSRAAIWLADEHESRGRDMQAVGILRLLAESDVPAASEAARRIARIENRGRNK